MKPWEKDPISVAPTIETGLTRAWLVDLDSTDRRDALVALWLIEAPWAHPIWHSYSLSLIHLRPLQDAQPPTLYLPGATHEILLQALDPDHPRQPMLAVSSVHALTPANFAAQMIAASDADAALLVAETVRLVADGKLNPDTDAIGQWVARFGDSMLKDRRPKH